MKKKHEYFPEREANLIDWLAIPSFTIVVLVAMMILGGPVLVYAAWGLALVVGGTTAMNYVPIQVRKRTVHVRGKRRELRILVISDEHFSPFSPIWLLAQLKARIAEIGRIDAVIFTGDNVELWWEPALLMLECMLVMLRELMPDVPMFACMGGHEIEAAKRIAEIFERYRVHYGQNVWAVEGDIAVWLARESDHPSRSSLNAEESWNSMKGSKPKCAQFYIIACHDPRDVTKEISKSIEGLDFVVSGHTHKAAIRQLGDVPHITNGALGAASAINGRAYCVGRIRPAEIGLIELKQDT